MHPKLPELPNSRKTRSFLRFLLLLAFLALAAQPPQTPRARSCPASPSSGRRCSNAFNKACFFYNRFNALAAEGIRVLAALRGRLRKRAGVQVAPKKLPTPISSHEWRNGGLQFPGWRQADPDFRFEFEKHFNPKSGLYPYASVRALIYPEFIAAVEAQQARSHEQLSRVLLAEFREGGSLFCAPVLGRSGVACLETYIRRSMRVLDQKTGSSEERTIDRGAL